MRKICLLAPLLLLLPPVSGQLRMTEVIHYDEEKTWKEAQDYCRKHHIDLVTVTYGMEQQEDVEGWTGLYWSSWDFEWRWSREDEIATFINRPIIPTPTVPGHENCAYRDRGKNEWHREKCDEMHSFTCYDENLVLVKENKTWEEALDHCRALRALDPSRPATDYQNHRYDLVTLLTEDDEKFAGEKAQQSQTIAVWTGRRFLAGQWVWVGGEEMEYIEVEKCPAVKHCGVVDKRDPKELSSRDCTWKKNFFCSKKTTNSPP